MQYDDIIAELDAAPIPTTLTGFLKAGFLGFAGSGKTFTMAKLAIGAYEFFNLSGPVIFFDTESGAKYVKATIERALGVECVIIPRKSYHDLMRTVDAVEKRNCQLFIAESITHPWRELCDAFLDDVNEKRAKKNRQPLTQLELSHWNVLKRQWAPWTDWFLNSPVHVLIGGRAGFEWEKVRNDETGRDELTKVGIKMKTESEFGFEPSLLVEMERVQLYEDAGDTPTKLVRRANVLKDRFDVLDGRVAENPTFEFFKPHCERLKTIAHTIVSGSSRGTLGVQDEQGRDDWAVEKKRRTVLAEEIQGELVAKWPSTSAEEKKQKGDMLFRIFGSRSWTQISEETHSSILADGLRRMRIELGTSPVPAEPTQETFADIEKPPLTPQVARLEIARWLGSEFAGDDTGAAGAALREAYEKVSGKKAPAKLTPEKVPDGLAIQMWQLLSGKPVEAF